MPESQAETAHVVEVYGGAHGWVHRCAICGYRGPDAPLLPCPGPQAENAQRAEFDHTFDPGWSGMSTACNALALRDGHGDDCGLPREHPLHVPPALPNVNEVARTHLVATLLGEPEGGCSGPCPAACGYACHPDISTPPAQTGSPS